MYAISRCTDELKGAKDAKWVSKAFTPFSVRRSKNSVFRSCSGRVRSGGGMGGGTSRGNGG